MFFLLVAIQLFACQAPTKQRIGIMSNINSGPTHKHDIFKFYGKFTSPKTKERRLDRFKPVSYPESFNLRPTFNECIVEKLVTQLPDLLPDYIFVPIPPTPFSNLDGYGIGGIWTDKCSTEVKNARQIAKKHQLDHLIIIVPSSYFARQVNYEIYGLDLYFVDNMQYTSLAYGILLFSKSEKGGYKKAFRSFRQTFVVQSETPKPLDYHKLTFEPYNYLFGYKALAEAIAPTLLNQVHAAITQKPRAIHKHLRKPRKPLRYCRFH